MNVLSSQQELNGAAVLNATEMQRVSAYCEQRRGAALAAHEPAFSSDDEFRRVTAYCEARQAEKHATKVRAFHFAIEDCEEEGDVEQADKLLAEIHQYLASVAALH